MEAPTPSRWLGEAVFFPHPAHCPADTVEVLAKGKDIRSKAGVKAWVGARVTPSVQDPDKALTFEVKISAGLCRIGCLLVGTDDKSWGYGGTAKISHAGRFQDWGEKFEVSDVISTTLDLHDMSISFAKNGRPLGKAFTGLSASLRNEHWHPAVAIREGSLSLLAVPFKPPTPPANCPLLQLPPNSIRLIALRMPLAAVARLARTCRYAASVLGERFWVRRVAQDMPAHAAVLPAEARGVYARVLRRCWESPHAGSKQYELTVSVEGGGGPVEIVSGFADGVLVNNVPLGSMYPDCAGSIGRCWTGYENRKEFEPYIAELTNKLNTGLIDLDNLPVELGALVRTLAKGRYKIGRKVLKVGGDVGFLDYEPTSVGELHCSWWEEARFVQETQPSVTDDARVTHYVQMIRRSLPPAPAPEPVPVKKGGPKGKAKAAAKYAPQPPPPRLLGPLPLLLVACTSTVDFILDGHHKYAAYRSANCAPVAIFIQPERTSKEAMARLLAGNEAGLALLAEFGPKK